MRKSRSNGLHLTKACNPLVFKQSALSVFGREARFSRVAGTYIENKSKNNKIWHKNKIMTYRTVCNRNFSIE